MSTGIERLRSAFRPDRAALVAYVPIGDPDAFDARTLDAHRDAGVAVLEVGIPTPDPWLDGPGVTTSMDRALMVGTDAASAAEALGAWRARHERAGRRTPAILWFSYPDLPLDTLERAAGAAAIDGLLMLAPWLHPDAAALPAARAATHVALSTFLPWESAPRDRDLARSATGYVMVQARPGATGTGATGTGATGTGATPADLAVRVSAARTLNPDVPVVAGFGVHDAASVRALLAAGVDGVVVGSTCIQVARAGGATGLERYLRDLVAVMGASSAGAA